MRCITVLILIISLHSNIIAGLIPIIKQFDNGDIKIEYYIDDECEECMKFIRPCPKHIKYKPNKMEEIDGIIEKYR